MINKDQLIIRQIAVLGAGVMGAQMSSHFANAGIHCLLFDIKAEGVDPNAHVKQAIKDLHQLKPPVFATKTRNQLISVANYEDDLEKLETCDLIIESIAENKAWKVALYQKIIPYLNQYAILATNSITLSINSLSEHLPPQFKSRFLCMHFFTPVRYMKLVELIPSNTFSLKLLDQLEVFLVTRLGKGIVRAADSLSSIPNRLGVFSLLMAMHYAKQFNLPIEVVDALTGQMIGHPSSATYQTIDIMGLDTFAQFIECFAMNFSDDPWSELFQMPEILHQLIELGALGQKTQIGFYRKVDDKLCLYDIEKKEYRESSYKPDTEVKAILQMHDPVQRFNALCQCDHEQAKFLSCYLRELLHYSLYLLEEIAVSVCEIDRAMCWGFAWQQGPFELWQQVGISNVIDQLFNTHSSHEAYSSHTLPHWLTHETQFYQNGKAFNVNNQLLQTPDDLPVYERQIQPQGAHVLFYEQSIKLWTYDHEIGFLNIDNFSALTASAVRQAIVMAEQRLQGVIIIFDKLAEINAPADNIHEQLKNCKLPMVAAIIGRVTRYTQKLMQICRGRVAAFESYWPLTGKQQHTTSALEALEAGILFATDTICMNSDEVLHIAAAKLRFVLEAGESFYLSREQYSV